MTADEIDKIVKNITYKPNVSIVFFVPFERNMYSFTITGKVKDVETRKDTKITLTASYQRDFFNFSSEVDIIEVVKGLIINIEDHEFKEWFKYSGKCVYEPHKKQ